MDPGLVTVAGHHFDIDLNTVRELVANGHSVHVYANRRADDTVVAGLGSLAEVTRLFTPSPYENPQRLDPIAGEAMLYMRQSNLLAQELRRSVPADLWLWPSIFAPQLSACALSGSKVPVAGCVHVDATPPDQSTGAMWWRHAFLSARNAGVRLRLGAIEPEHRYGYLPLTTDASFDVFPVPHEGRPIASPRRELRTIGFFGHQRGEKGSSRIPQLVARLLHGGYRIVSQSSGEQAPVPNHPAVTKLGFVDVLGDEIAKCDLIVLPYEPVRYRTKGSGILWESLATGIPVVAPYDTAPGRWIERTGAGTLFIEATPEAIHEAVTRARDDYPRIAKAAWTASREWPKRHGVANFVREMIAL